MSNVSETRTIKMSEAMQVLPIAFAQKRPVFMWGPPGIGKSEMVKEIAASGKLGNTAVVDMRLALFEPTDLRGYPVPDVASGTMKWLPPSDLPTEEMAAQYDTVILFLDELNSAAPSVQAAAYQLILDRKIGQYRLPENVVVMAAGNRETDKGVSYRMPKPLENRFVHFELRVDFTDWFNWAVKNKVHADVVGFLTFAKNDLYQFDPKSSSRGFATPRSWTYVGGFLDGDAGQLPDGLQTDVVAGCIGEGTAIKFMAHRKIAGDLPDPSDVLDGKVSTLKTKEISAMYALATSLCYELKDRSDKCKETGDSTLFDESFSNFISYTMDNFETEMVIMASRIAMKNYGLVPQQSKIARFQDFFDRYGRLVLDA